MKTSFAFLEQESYAWAKAVLSNLSARLYLNEHPIPSFRIFCADERRLLILTELNQETKNEFLELFELNGLIQVPQSKKAPSEKTPLVSGQQFMPGYNQNHQQRKRFLDDNTIVVLQKHAPNPATTAYKK